MENKKTLKIIYSLIGILIVAGLGSLFVFLGMNWFNATKKPSQWIPNFVIPIVWSVIYVIFAIIIVMMINKNETTKKFFILTIINGVFNILWCLIFFTLKLTFLGNVIIVINTIFAYLLWIDVNNKSNIYGYFFALYPVWLSLATTLNLAIWILN